MLADGPQRALGHADFAFLDVNAKAADSVADVSDTDGTEQLALGTDACGNVDSGERLDRLLADLSLL